MDGNLISTFNKEKALPEYWDWESLSPSDLWCSLQNLCHLLFMAIKMCVYNAINMLGKVNVYQRICYNNAFWKLCNIFATCNEPHISRWQCVYTVTDGTRPASFFLDPIGSLVSTLLVVGWLLVMSHFFKICSFRVLTDHW